MKIKKYKMLILSIILLIGTILLVWYANEINMLLIPIIVFILILSIASAFYYTVRLIKKGKYLNLFNIGINDGSILIGLFILFELLNLDKLDDEFFKCSEFT